MELLRSTGTQSVFVEMKQRNPTWGCPRIAQQMALAFNIQIDKDVVRRIFAHHYLPGQESSVLVEIVVPQFETWQSRTKPGASVDELTLSCI
jgi:hypothetical protein